MDSKIFVGLLTLDMLAIGFEASTSLNKNCVHFVNKRGNSSYVFFDDQSATLTVFKVSKSCLSVTIKDFNSESIQNIITNIKEKLNL